MSSSRLRELFEAAVERPPEDRSSFLDRACAGDAGLRARVEKLLNAVSDAGRFLAEPTGGSEEALRVEVERPRVDAEAGTLMELDAGDPTGSGPQPSERIGRYKLLQRIGEGGFGEVWMAEQTEPVRRRVALKVVKLGMDTRRLIARFEAERQALALMDHPNIARVLDAGATEQGRPYFVMELVRGVAITEYCDGENLAIDERLELFRDVCLAVQHAHQKGIIHRDLKPSNVLVSVADGRATPRVIDFGIAKATQGALTEKTLFTEFRQLMGTPAYMSPEQAEMSGVDIDTRSDVYGLGVLLYELLTGTTPFSTQELMAEGVAEIHRIIREVEPAKPSTKLSTSEALPSIAAHRHTEPKRLGALVRGDLDWIVMRCLEKDRGRRYATASALAEDVRRHLAGEAVEAAPPGRAYRARKFVRRHRVGVLAGALVALALLAGISGTTWGLVWALDEKARADRNATAALAASHREAEARAEAETNATMAGEEAERAERELARAREVKRFITEMLASVNPATAQGRDTALLREILDGAAARIEAGEIEDERIEAELGRTIGMAYIALAEYERAEPFLSRTLAIQRRALGTEHEDTLLALNSLGLLLQGQGKLSEAEACFREVLETRQRLHGNAHADTLVSLANVGSSLLALGRPAEAEPLLREALEAERRAGGEEHPNTIVVRCKLAGALRSLNRLDEAELLLREALEIGRRVLGNDDPDTLIALESLGNLLRARGRLDEAEPFLREALESSRRILGEEHSETLVAVNSLGTFLYARGSFDEAEPLLREAYEGLRRELGDDHRNTLIALSNLGSLLQAMRKPEHAEACFRDLLERRRRVLGPVHPSTLGASAKLGDALDARGRHREAAAQWRAGLVEMRAKLGPEDPLTLATAGRLGKSLAEQHEYAEAETLLLEALEGMRRAQGEDHVSTLSVRLDLGKLWLEIGRHDEAHEVLTAGEAAARRALVPAAKGEGDGHALGAYLLALGMASAGTRARVEAERALLDAHAAFSASPDEREREAGTRPCARELAALYDAWHLAEPGAGHDEQALVWRERSLDGELK